MVAINRSLIELYRDDVDSNNLRTLKGLRVTGGLQFAQEEQRITGYTVRKNYPFIDFKEWKRNFISIPLDYVLYKIFGYFKSVIPEPENRETILSKIFGGFCDAEYKSRQQRLDAALRASFPKVMIWADFAYSPSTIEELYTVEWTNPPGPNREIPIYYRIKKKGEAPGPVPQDTELADQIRKVRDEKTPKDKIQSPYNKMGGEYYDEAFDKTAVDKYTRGDFGRFIDPGRFNRWFVRDDSWVIQQYGPRLNGHGFVNGEKSLNVDGVNYTVRRYGRPSPLMMWWYWVVGDKVYDFIDGAFDPIQRLAGKIFSLAAQQSLVTEEYKMIAGIRRSMFDNPSRLDLTYELN